MTPDPTHTQLAEQVAELKKERDVWQGRYRAAYNLACDKDKQIAALKAELAEARRALADLFALVEDGTLIRDISHDHELAWAMRQLPLVKALSKAKAALAGAEGKA